MAFLPVDDQLELISRGTEEVIPLKDLRKKLEHSIERISRKTCFGNFDQVLKLTVLTFKLTFNERKIVQTTIIKFSF